MTGRIELLGTRRSLGTVFLYEGVAKQPDNAASLVLARPVFLLGERQ